MFKKSFLTLQFSHFFPITLAPHSQRPSVWWHFIDFDPRGKQLQAENSPQVAETTCKHREETFKITVRSYIVQ